MRGVRYGKNANGERKRKNGLWFVNGLLYISSCYVLLPDIVTPFLPITEILDHSLYHCTYSFSTVGMASMYFSISPPPSPASS